MKIAEEIITHDTINKRIESDIRLNQISLAKKIGRYPYFFKVDSASTSSLEIDGRIKLNFGSNNYLGLTTHPDVITAGINAINKYGSGLTGSRPLNGSLDLHEQLELDIAKFYNAEAALVLPPGYTANLGFVCGILKRHDTVIFDAEIHASLLDGVLLSQAKFKRFRHNDIEHFEEQILKLKDKPTLCIIEGIYSMTGDNSDIVGISKICKKYNIMLFIDEAHGIGVAGERGRGVVEMQNAMDLVDVISITFSKSLGSCGGAIIGKKNVIDYLKTHSRPFIFTASNTPSAVASTIASLKLLNENPQFIQELQDKKNYLYDKFLEKGLPVTKNDSAIISINIGSDFRVTQAWKTLFNRDIYCNPVVTPAVQHNQGILRFSVMRTHTYEELDRTAEICKSILPIIKQ